MTKFIINAKEESMCCPNCFSGRIDHQDRVGQLWLCQDCQTCFNAYKEGTDFTVLEKTKEQNFG